MRIETLSQPGCDHRQIATWQDIEATDDAEGSVIMLGFYQKGVAVLLADDEALDLGRVLNRIREAARPQSGGKNDYRA